MKKEIVFSIITTVVGDYIFSEPVEKIADSNSAMARLVQDEESARRDIRLERLRELVDHMPEEFRDYSKAYYAAEESKEARRLFRELPFNDESLDAELLQKQKNRRRKELEGKMLKLFQDPRLSELAKEIGLDTNVSFLTVQDIQHLVNRLPLIVRNVIVEDRLTENGKLFLIHFSSDLKKIIDQYQPLLSLEEKEAFDRQAAEFNGLDTQDLLNRFKEIRLYDKGFADQESAIRAIELSGKILKFGSLAVIFCLVAIVGLLINQLKEQSTMSLNSKVPDEIGMIFAFALSIVGVAVVHDQLSAVVSSDLKKAKVDKKNNKARQNELAKPFGKALTL